MTNIGAFLATIRRSEGTDKAPDPYAVTFGYKFTITDFSDHPALLGTWSGEPLDFLGPQYAGKVSTAAGAYQIIRPTWISLRDRLRLPDFRAPSQNAAATELIRQAGALDLVNTGQVADAISRCRGIWASLPGSVSGQPQAKMADLLDFYVTAGGAFA
jgi:lysozyme